MLSTFQPFDFKPISKNIEFSKSLISFFLVVSLIFQTALMILANTCKREFIKLKYTLFKHLTVKLMAITC